MGGYPLFAALMTCASIQSVAAANTTADRRALPDAHLASDLSLSESEFDQVEGKGWRALAEIGCETEVSLLIRRYIDTHASAGPVLRWHLAQSLAMQGRIAAAISEGRLAFKSSRLDIDEVRHWNAYVSGSLAHWAKDRGALNSALDSIRKTSLGSRPNDPLRLALEWLERCFDEPYSSKGCN